MMRPVAKPARGALSIPSADGYHYADEHPWDADDQAELTDGLWDTVRHFRESHEDVPVFDAQSCEA